MTDALARALALRAAAHAVLKDMECDHSNSDHGVCFDCRGYGYDITCQQEEDIVTACLAIVRATDELEPT